MAKQSGIHQIRGKIGEHSYYRQSGVAQGLIRSINQGMSARVKTAEEFLNTRLNNAEFGQACKVAANFIKLITPKFRPMFLTFSQAKVAKDVLALIKQQTGVSWGERNFVDENGENISPILNKLAKNDFSGYGITYAVTDTEQEPALDLNGADMMAKANEYGADGMYIKVILGDVYVGTYLQTGARSYAPTRALGASATITISEFEDDQVVLPASLVAPPSPAAGAPVTESRVLILVAMPYRNVGADHYILQEACSFKVLPWSVYETGE